MTRYINRYVINAAGDAPQRYFAFELQRDRCCSLSSRHAGERQISESGKNGGDHDQSTHDITRY